MNFKGLTTQHQKLEQWQSIDISMSQRFEKYYQSLQIWNRIEISMQDHEVYIQSNRSVALVQICSTVHYWLIKVIARLSAKGMLCEIFVKIRVWKRFSLLKIKCKGCGYTVGQISAGKRPGIPSVDVQYSRLDQENCN